MKQELYNVFSLLAQVATAVGLLYFAWKQTQINKRMKELEDFVAVSIVPFFADNEPKLQVINAGRINLYLKRYEVGSLTATFEKEKLLVCGTGNPFYIIPVPKELSKEMPVKLYLKDEFGNKYLSTGAVIIDAFPMMAPPPIPQAPDSTPLPPPQGPNQISIRTNIRGWSYKTERYNWMI